MLLFSSCPKALCRAAVHYVSPQRWLIFSGGGTICCPQAGFHVTSDSVASYLLWNAALAAELELPTKTYTFLAHLVEQVTLETQSKCNTCCIDFVSLQRP